MKKKLYSSICLWCFIIVTLCACGKQGNPIVLPDREEIISVGASDSEKSGLSPNTEEEADAMWDRIPMVRVNDKLYYDTGKENTVSGHCGNMDGEITSTVDGTEIPMKDNQSNFGSGFGYQYGEDGTIEIYMNEKWFIFEYREPSVIKTYDNSEPAEEGAESDGLVVMVKHYEMSDGTWKTDDYTYQYRLEITGRMGGAEKDNTFVFLSNIKNITFEQAWKAAGFSSNTADYFKKEDATFVAMR